MCIRLTYKRYFISPSALCVSDLLTKGTLFHQVPCVYQIYLQKVLYFTKCSVCFRLTYKRYFCHPVFTHYHVTSIFFRRNPEFPVKFVQLPRTSCIQTDTTSCNLPWNWSPLISQNSSELQSREAPQVNKQDGVCECPTNIWIVCLWMSYEYLESG